MSMLAKKVWNHKGAKFLYNNKKGIVKENGNKMQKFETPLITLK